jgi:beta-phosphoglucomutase
MNLQAVLFDLDGVIVDTARFHYQAWKRLADALEIPFTEKQNERLKGVSRMESLSILLSLSPKPLHYSPDEIEDLAAKKTVGMGIISTHSRKRTSCPDSVSSWPGV